MALTLETLGPKLRLQSGVTTTEYSDSDLEMFLRLAAGELEDASIDTDNLSYKIAAVLLMRALIDLSYSRASRSTGFYEIRSEEGHTKPQQVVSNNLSFAATLEKRYDSLLASSGIGPSEVFVSVARSYSRRTQNVNPFWSKSDPPAAAILSGVAVDGKAELTWTRCTNISFSYYSVYQHTTAGIVDLMRFGASSNIAVAEGATLTGTESKVDAHYLRTNTLTPGTYYFVVYTFLKDGALSYSNEITVTI